MIEKRWALQDAKTHFSSMLDQAQSNGPQMVTKDGEDAVVVLSSADYQKLTKPKTSLVEFLQNSPLAEEDLDLTSSKELPRNVDL